MMAKIIQISKNVITVVLGKLFDVLANNVAKINKQLEVENNSTNK